MYPEVIEGALMTGIISRVILSGMCKCLRYIIHSLAYISLLVQKIILIREESSVRGNTLEYCDVEIDILL